VLPRQAGCPPGARFHYSSKKKDALPTQLPGNTQTAKFECAIPVAALTSPAHAALYGHGLLGSPDEIDGGNVKDMSQEHDFAFCATAWSGMSDEDVPNAGKLLGDLSGFASLADRDQQGFLNQLYLGRLFIHPSGLTANSAFKGLVDESQLYFDGNSQGGIFGAALTAMAPDFTRAVLGVPGSTTACCSRARRIGRASAPSSTPPTRASPSDRSRSRSSTCCGTAVKVTAGRTTSPPIRPRARRPTAC
jgi:hypothetical protein